VAGYLLDTQTFIWFIEGSDQLPQESRTLISRKDTPVFFSMVSVWEMAIKISIKKLKFRDPLPVLVQRHCPSDFTLLPIRLKDLFAVEKLSMIHRDPFDRLLVVQTQGDSLEILSSDPIFDKYGVKRIG
jgi:PIN domain nuclease of toxin-antitoxin system